MDKNIDERIRRIVKEELERLLEYAIPRAKFVDNVARLAYQITENWCLVHYCTLIGGHQTQGHWKKELYAHLTNIANDTIKRNNSHATRLKAIQEGFMEKDLPTNVERVDQIVQGKFSIEGFDADSEEYQTTISDFHNSLPSIMELLASGTPKDIGNHIQGI